MGQMRTLTINGEKYDIVPVVPASSVTLLANAWVADGDKHSQVVEVSGVTAHTKVDLQPTAEQLEEFHYKVLAFVTENDGGKVTVYSIGDKPENDHTIQITKTEVEGVGKIRGNTVGTTMPKPDWNQTDPNKADYIRNKPTLSDGVYGTTPVFETTLSETLTTYLTVNKKADGTPLRLKAVLVLLETAETAGGETYCHVMSNGIFVQQAPLYGAAAKSYAYVEYYLRHGKWRSNRHTFVSRTDAYTHYTGMMYRDINFDAEQYPVIDTIRLYYLPAGTKIKIYGVEENV